MKVICIKQESKEANTGEVLKPELIIGNEYTVIAFVDRGGREGFTTYLNAIVIPGFTTRCLQK
jgi:hypothetical protein